MEVRPDDLRIGMEVINPPVIMDCSITRLSNPLDGNLFQPRVSQQIPPVSISHGT